MMRKQRHSPRIFLCQSLSSMLLIVVVLISAGCASRATQYYVLDATPSEKTGALESADRLRVAVRQIDIPQYLDTSRMVMRDSGNQLKIAEYHQWGGRLRDNIARILADNLATRLPNATVSMVPFPGSLRAELAVLLDIRQFERMPGGHVHLQVQWHVQGRDGSQVSRLEHLQSQVRVTENDYGGMAALMSVLMGRLSDHLALAIREMPAEQQ